MNKYKYLSLFYSRTGTTLSLSAQHHLSANGAKAEQGIRERTDHGQVDIRESDVQ